MNKRTIAALLVTLSGALASVAIASDTPQKPEDSPLVKASKAAGGPKRKPTKKVITNADVKKSRGKLTELPGSKATITLKMPDVPKNSQADFEEQRRAAAAAAKKVEKAEAGVATLEAELARIEQSYYEANDPDERDTTIKRRFDQTKQQLDAARKQLAEAREAQKALTPKSP